MLEKLTDTTFAQKGPQLKELSKSSFVPKISNESSSNLALKYDEDEADISSLALELLRAEQDKTSTLEKFVDAVKNSPDHVDSIVSALKESYEKGEFELPSGNELANLLLDNPQFLDDLDL